MALLRAPKRLSWSFPLHLHRTRPVSTSVSFQSPKFYKSVPEQPVPVKGTVKGAIPDWLNGRLLRNGPGQFKFGDMKYNHWFDGQALLHSFTIQSGKVTYTSKFLRGTTYKHNMAANRILVTEFGTLGVPDPCQTIFQRVQSYFTSFVDRSQGVTDNCNVNVYPAGDKYIAATETDFVHVFSPETLDSKERVQLSKHVAVNRATAHPHYESDGTVYNLGSSSAGYSIVKMSPTSEGQHVMDKASILCTVPPKNKFKPGYSHSFGATENYLIFLEQPFRIDILKVLRGKIFNKSVMSSEALLFDKDEPVRFYVVEKSTGKVQDTKLLASPFLVFHHINAYEDNGNIVLDVCAHEDGSVYFTSFVKKLNEGTSRYSVEPRRYVLPIQTEVQNADKNLVSLDYTTATAEPQSDGSIMCKHEVISEKGFEMPCINYKHYNGKPYQFAYGTNRPFTELIKTDLKSKQSFVWTDKTCNVSEPVFVSKPGSSQEDEGVILSAVLQSDESKPPFLLVLDARSMTELGRVEFPGIQMHKDMHGFFVTVSCSRYQSCIQPG